MSKVYLVGAGPGDPGLLTLKGRQAIERADAILFDHLANESLLRWARPGAERLYVGKKKSDHSHSQDEIAALLIERAREGKTVVRLKGGDPFMIGRGGEEAEALHAAGVDYEVVPGVTAPLGIAAYSGVPLTHRDHSPVVTFVTGHDCQRVDWSTVSGSQTLVIFMGLTAIHEIVPKLLAAGRDPATPTMAVRWGTRPEQTTVRAPLARFPEVVTASGMRPPATVIIGEVVRLGEKLNWFERLPLFGKRVVVTRAEEQAGEFADKLRALGADAIELPVIEMAPAPDYAPLDAAIERLDEFDWLIFTSVNGVRFFLERLDASPFDLRRLRARVCAIGPATKAAVESLHVKVDVAPAKYVAEGLIEALESHDLAGKRVLLPRAAGARDVLPRALAERGASVSAPEAYRAVCPESSAERAREIAANPPDWVTFTSSSTVKNFVALAGPETMRTARAASIGPVTSETLRMHGIEPAAEADPYTTDGLIEAILRATRGQRTAL